VSHPQAGSGLEWLEWIQTSAFYQKLSSADPKARREASIRLIEKLDQRYNHITNKNKSQINSEKPHQEYRSLIALIDHKIPPVARSAFLYALSHSEHARSLEPKWLTLSLKSDSAKVRKATASLLERHPLLSSEELMNALNTEEAHFVRERLITALGQCSSAEVRDALEAYTPRGPKEERARQVVLRRLGGGLETSNQESKPLFDRYPIPQGRLTFLTPSGLTWTLMEECLETTDLKSSKMNKIVPELSLETLSMSAPITRPRCASVLALPLQRLTSPTSLSLMTRASRLVSRWTDRLRDRPASQEALRRLSMSASAERIQYRVDLPKTPTRHLREQPRQRRKQHREMKRERSQLLDQLSTTLHPHGHWIESPSRYDFQFRFHFSHVDLLYLDLSPFTRSPFPSLRISVGASIASETAAGLARWSRYAWRRHQSIPSPSAHRDHRVIDPTCGSGALLFERGLLAQASGERVTLIGVDVSEVAYRAASKNADLWGLDPQMTTTKLTQGDSSKASVWCPFDEALMNLPFGMRVKAPQGDRAPHLVSALEERAGLKALYESILHQAITHMKSRATLTIYTTQRRLMESLCHKVEKSGELMVLERAQVISGDLYIGVWILGNPN
jgi:predicted RNA methylase